MRILLFILFIGLCSPLAAQYAPQAGVPGSTAIYKADGSFVRWATGCTVQRGYLNIDTPSLGVVSNGADTDATGYPDRSVVSLGDSGVAVVTFPGTLYDGPGADFAIFENGFVNPANDSQAFLELAYVEVSSDGVNYARFPSHSLTQTTTQIAGAGDYMYANLLDGLAGKYGADYGTPFDLADVATSGVNINAITHIRIVDVIGSIRTHSSQDIAGNIINDPFPTQFPTGGFDLDAVGAIHYNSGVGVPGAATVRCVRVYPNPTNGRLYLQKHNADELDITLTTVAGSIAGQWPAFTGGSIDMEQLPAGLYYLSISDKNGNRWVEKVTRQ